ncbi:signal peptidase II [Sediminibacillus halophilus]|uniref:Lipoprotein signal peptidase n=1 Tax=Sediminibacillus halophilus TaxID=482461 RepID=A0A1G9MQC5_9BACI|nr:signal peptidase II [Sediminibacillus halophilus]SDL76221.1 signal peptidase II [Sediminibacillus halophilus]
MQYYILAVIIVLIDQLSKWWIIKNMEIGEQFPVIENFFYITSHRNTGAAWGMLEGQMWFFYIVTAIVVLFVIYYIRKFARTSKWMGLALGLILGGAVGNFIDRLFRKEVVDFFDVYLGSYDYPIFNVADSALVCGVIIVLIMTFVDEKKKGRTAK